MAYMQRFKGRVAAASFYLTGSNPISKIGGQVRQPIALAAVATTDFPLQLPQGATLESFRVYTTTAFTASTDVQIQVGSTLGGSDIVAPISIKTVNLQSLTLLGASALFCSALPAGNPNLFVRVTQTGTPTAVGAALALVGYATP